MAWLGVRLAGRTFETVGIAMNELAKIGIIFGVATLPWGEVVFAIPLGIALGLHAVAVFAIAVAGNIASVLAVVLGLRRCPWLRDVFLRRGSSHRVVRVMERYGVAGLSAQAPIISGGHLAALVALFLGVRSRTIAIWLSFSIICWGTAITVLGIQGKFLVLGLLG